MELLTRGNLINGLRKRAGKQHERGHGKRRAKVSRGKVELKGKKLDCISLEYTYFFNYRQQPATPAVVLNAASFVLLAKRQKQKLINKMQYCIPSNDDGSILGSEYIRTHPLLPKS